MKHVKNYLPLQVLLLCALSVENRSAIKKGLRVATIPRVVSGPGKIIDISKESLARNDESKDINDLLYQVYRQFKKDAKKQATGDFTKAEVVKKTEMPNMQPKLVKKEKHQIALKELERTIDKLIASLTRVDDGKFEEKEINKGIEDMSKFADLSSINIPADNDPQMREEGNDEMEHFRDFKERFYKTFTDVGKRQGMIYHGKRDEITPRIVYHGKDNVAKPNGDSTNKMKASKWELIKQQLDVGMPDKKSTGISSSNREQNFVAGYDQQSRRNVNSINGERMKELADLYEKLKKRTAEERKYTNVQTLSQGGRHRDRGQERSVDIERVKTVLVSLLDLISNNEDDVSGGNRKDSLHQDDGTEDKYQKKRRLLLMVRSLEAQLDSRGLPEPNDKKGNNVPSKISDRFESELDNFVSGMQSPKSNNKYANSAFADAIKGFAPQSKALGKKSAQ